MIDEDLSRSNAFPTKKRQSVIAKRTYAVQLGSPASTPITLSLLEREKSGNVLYLSLGARFELYVRTELRSECTVDICSLSVWLISVLFLLHPLMKS